MAGEEFAFDVLSNGGKFLFKDGGIRAKLRKGPEQLKRAAFIAAEQSAPDVESYMKRNAPWNDQTGNARAGLGARAFREGDDVGIVLFHSVDYGIYLETRYSGAYAIIDPTIEAMRDPVMRRFERIMERM